jgi:PAS domain S-box-containing protein
MKILVVDDIARNRRLMGAILNSEGHQVLEAADGVEAMEILEKEPVDAVISDILMPRMDGYRFCHELRAIERFRNLPFIFHTSSYTSPSDEKLALDMGADRFLTKPAPASEVIKALGEATSIHRRAFVPVRPDRELVLMKEYNQQLVSKLEQKNDELTIRNDELHDMHEQLRHLLEHSPAVVYQLEIEGETIVPVVVTENIQQLLGVSKAEHPTFEWWTEHLHPEDKDRVVEQFLRSVEGRGCSMEYRIRHQDGSYRWIADNSRVVKNGVGKPTEVFGVWTDVTERREAEEKIASQLRELQRWRDATLNREDRVQSLKQEINDLLKESGRPQRYANPPTGT